VELQDKFECDAQMITVPPIHLMRLNVNYLTDKDGERTIPKVIVDSVD